MFVNGEISFYDKARYKHGVWMFHIFVMRSFKDSGGKNGIGLLPEKVYF